MWLELQKVQGDLEQFEAGEMGENFYRYYLEFLEIYIKSLLIFSEKSQIKFEIWKYLLVTLASELCSSGW